MERVEKWKRMDSVKQTTRNKVRFFCKLRQKIESAYFLIAQNMIEFVYLVEFASIHKMTLSMKWYNVVLYIYKKPEVDHLLLLFHENMIFLTQKYFFCKIKGTTFTQ